MNDYNDYIISENLYLVDIMKRIDQTEKGTVYVCDSDKILLGVITDGDIRRAIIRHGKLDLTARTVMKKDPITLDESEIEYSMIVMKKNVIHSVPIINKKGQLVDIRFDHDNRSQTVHNKKINVPVVIMAGGKGSRLQPYTNILPKPLIPIGDKTICEHIIGRFEKSGCDHFDIIVNYKKGLIEAYFDEKKGTSKITFVEEDTPLGTAGGLRLLQKRYSAPFFVSNCDILVEADYPDIYEYHQKNGNIATIVCAIKNTTLPYGVITMSESGKISQIKEKPTISSLVNTGFYVVNPEFIDRIPDGEVVQIPDVFRSCIDDGLRVGVYPISEDSWMDMGQFDELRSMTERVKEIV